MPIRMEDDPMEPGESSGGEGGGGGGFGEGGGGLFALLPLLLSLIRGRSLLVVLALLVGGYFFFGRGACNLNSSQNSPLSTGGVLDPRQFAKAKIYESLDDDDSKNPLPESANLQKFAPSVGDQGHQGSCVAWSSAYGARTIEEAIRTGKDPNSVRFSPSFLFNQIGLGGCDGSYIERAMEFMTQKGSVGYDRFPYSDQDCSAQPDQQLLEEAEQYRMRGANRLSEGDRTDAIDL
ncbi:MAG TPA: C1 family peptidase, partial [Puia sp.]|nr:C1 family peptidase [Puia sp.]